MGVGRHGRGLGEASFGVFVTAVFCGACAAGADGPPTGAATSGEPSTSATTSSSTSVGTTTGGEGAASPTGGTGGSGGDGQGAGGAGAGGTGTGGAGAGGTGGDGGSGTGGAGGDGTGGASSSTGTGGAGGGEPVGVVTLLATGPTGGLAAVREGGVWSTDPLAGALSSSRPALAMLDATSALGLVRTSSDALHHTTWSGASWAAFTSIGGGTTTRDAPALDATNGVAFATFHGSDFRHYYARYDGSFTLLGETIGGVATPSFGPTAAGIAALGSQPVVAFAGDDDGLYAQARGAATWPSATPIALGGQAVDRTPAVTTLAGDVPLVVASTNGTTLVWSRRTGGVWSSAVAVAVDALSADAPALSAIPGGAALTYRGTNGGVYASIFDAGAGTWSSPERVVAAVTTPSTPAVAAGVGNANVELAYIDAATGAAHHVRRTGSTWGAPVLVGGDDLTGVALATPP